MSGVSAVFSTEFKIRLQSRLQAGKSVAILARETGCAAADLRLTQGLFLHQGGRKSRRPPSFLSCSG